jgi:hypothetical protein
VRLASWRKCSAGAYAIEARSISRSGEVGAIADPGGRSGVDVPGVSQVAAQRVERVLAGSHIGPWAPTVHIIPTLRGSYGPIIGHEEKGLRLRQHVVVAAAVPTEARLCAQPAPHETPQALS